MRSIECDIKCTVMLNIFEVRIYNILTAREDLIISSRDASKVTRLVILPIKTLDKKVATSHRWIISLKQLSEQVCSPHEISTFAAKKYGNSILPLK